MKITKNLQITLVVLALGSLLGFLSVYSGIFIKAKVDDLTPPTIDTASNLTGALGLETVFQFDDREIGRRVSCDNNLGKVDVPAEQDFHFIYRKEQRTYADM